MLAGSFDWDTKGATPKAFEFAKRMSQRMELLATQQELLLARRHRHEVGLGLRAARLAQVVAVRRQRDARQDGDDGHGDHDLDQREAALSS